VSFFDPLLNFDGQPYHRVKFKSIVQEQIVIGYLSQGGVSFGDTERMTPYERQIAYDTLKEIIDSQIEGRKKAMEEHKNNQGRR